jgi:hypothetical protein
VREYQSHIMPIRPRCMAGVELGLHSSRIRRALLPRRPASVSIGLIMLAIGAGGGRRTRRRLHAAQQVRAVGLVWRA